MRIAISRLIVGMVLGCSLSANAGAACDEAAYKQFDFWIGHWKVRTPDGKLAGTNRITREYAGCVLHERYTTARGYSGESLNTYDPGRKTWHQTWVDNEGTLLLLEGRFIDGGMRLEGQTTDPTGKVTKHRITWTAHDDGSVSQLWESADGKGAWMIAFDGKYTKQ